MKHIPGITFCGTLFLLVSLLIIAKTFPAGLPFLGGALLIFLLAMPSLALWMAFDNHREKKLDNREKRLDSQTERRQRDTRYHHATETPLMVVPSYQRQEEYHG